MATLSGNWFIDGIDIYDVFKVFLEEGSAYFLKFPPRKDSLTHDWLDANGIDVDTSRPFLGPRDVPLNLAIIATDQEDFFLKQSQFLSHLIQPGLRRISLRSHGERSYYVYYKETNNIKPEAPLKGELTGLFAYRFTILFVEPEPQIDASHIFLVDHEGTYIIT
jgi:hypothetical protein